MFSAPVGTARPDRVECIQCTKDAELTFGATDLAEPHIALENRTACSANSTLGDTFEPCTAGD